MFGVGEELLFDVVVVYEFNAEEFDVDEFDVEEFDVEVYDAEELASLFFHGV